MKGPIKLVSHDDLPAWSLDNEYIVNGYRTPGGINDERKARTNGAGKVETAKTRLKRRNGGSAAQEEKIDEPVFYEHNSIYRCWLSIWLYLHNETINIHTHLWGALIALAGMALHLLSTQDLVPSSLYPITHHPIFYPKAFIPAPLPSPTTSWLYFVTGKRTAAPTPPTTLSIAALITTPVTKITPWLVAHQRPNDWKDIIGFTSYLIGALTVLTFSATFHTVVCHSKEFSHTCNKLDYIGIVAMIVGSFIPMLHYGFYCHPHLQLFYSVSILSLGGLATYTVLSSKFTTPAYRVIRTYVFLALGLSAIFPVAHICAMYGYEAVSATMGLDWLVTGGALYVIGACLYMARVPERFSPGTFDYFGASHQIFHVLILFAAASHYICIRRAYTFWHTVEAINGDGGAICQAFESLRHGH